MDNIIHACLLFDNVPDGCNYLPSRYSLSIFCSNKLVLDKESLSYAGRGAVLQGRHVAPFNHIHHQKFLTNGEQQPPVFSIYQARRNYTLESKPDKKMFYYFRDIPLMKGGVSLSSAGFGVHFLQSKSFKDLTQYCDRLTFKIIIDLPFANQ